MKHFLVDLAASALGVALAILFVVILLGGLAVVFTLATSTIK